MDGHHWDTRTVKGTPRLQKLELLQSLYSDHHGVRTNQVLDASFYKTAFSHPPLAISARVVKSTGRFYQHVQTHEQAEDVFATFVVDHGVINDHCAPAWDCLKRFAEQCSLSIDIPIMQDVAQDDDVSLRQRVGKEVSRYKSQAVKQLLACYELLVNWLDFR